MMPVSNSKVSSEAGFTEEAGDQARTRVEAIDEAALGGHECHGQQKEVHSEREAWLSCQRIAVDRSRVMLGGLC
jgi:hypothetical protein